MEKGNKRMAVLVGCNYEDTPNELHGCINDVVAMRDMLVNRFGFDPSNIELLTDAPGSLDMPTGVNIKRALHEMVDKAEPGDVLYFHYSGHGIRIPLSRLGYPQWQDEAIVPCDYNIITDVDFRQLVNCVPEGASLTILSDSCHSGGLIEKEKEQIGPSTVANKTTPALQGSIRPKWIPFQDLLNQLTSLTGLNTSDIGTHLLESFGNDASLKFRMTPCEATEFVNPDEGILLSGCQANETSADMNPSDQNGGKAYGAFSNAVQIVLHNHSGKLSNREVVMLAREVLKEQGFEQHPCLYCTDGNADATFLSQPWTKKFNSL